MTQIAKASVVVAQAKRTDLNTRRGAKTTATTPHKYHWENQVVSTLAHRFGSLPVNISEYMCEKPRKSTAEAKVIIGQ